MARSAGHAVAKLCQAQELMREASQLIIGARLNTIDMSDRAGSEGPAFSGSPLERGLDRLAGDIGDQADALDNEIGGLARLIPERDS